MYIKLNRTESKMTRFVQRATAKDESRPILCGIHINGAMVGVDGYRLHAIRSTAVPAINEELPDDSTFILATVKKGENIVDPDFIQGSFPDFVEIIDGITPEPEAEVCFDPEFMLDAMRELDKGEPTRIVLHGKSNPLEIHGVIDGRPCYALITAMHKEVGTGEQPLTWKPTAEVE